MFRQLIRNRPHVLSEPEEQLLAGASALGHGSYNTFRTLTSAELEYAPQGAVITRSGAPASWPKAIFDTFKPSSDTFARDRWNWPSDGGDTTYELRIQMPGGTGYQSDPIYTLGDFRIEFWANYQIPLPDINWDGPTTTTMEFAVLTPGAPDDPLPTGSILVERNATGGRRIGIDTTFYWPPHPTGPVAGYTAPLEKWVGTTITGHVTCDTRLTTS